MILKQILIYLLCLSLAFPLETFASAPNSQVSNSPLMGLLLQHREIKTGVGSIKMIAKHGKALADLTFKMMADPKNKIFLSTPAGIELRRNQLALSNYLAVKDYFEKCVKNKNAKRKLHERILESAIQNMSKNDLAVPCRAPMNPTKSFVDFNNDIMKAMKSMVRPHFQNQLTKQVMTNTAQSLLAFRFKFDPNFMNQGVLKQTEMMNIIDTICNKKTSSGRSSISTDVCSGMGPGFKKKLAQDLIDFSKKQPRGAKLSPEKATALLNSAIDRINSSLSKVKVNKDSGYIYDSANLKDPKARVGFDQYINQYMIEVSRDAGSLLLSKTMKDEAGTIRSFSTSDTVKNRRTTNFEFKPHKKVELNDVKNSIKEIEGKMLTQARDTLAIAGDATKVKGKLISDNDDINELVKINPFAAGQVLLRHPQYAGLMCDAINNINQNDVNDANMDKYFVVGGAILGGALLLTGVGTVAGAYLITGSLTAGIAAGTIGGTVLGYTALAGTAIELTKVGYYGKKSYDAYQEMNQLEAAYLTQNSDSRAITDAKNALIEYKDARLAAGIALASAGFNIINFGRLFDIVKVFHGKISPSQIRGASKIMQFLAQVPVAKKIKDVVVKLGSLGAEKMDKFLVYLAQIGDASRLKFLALLKDAKITPEKLKEIIETSLEAAKKCVAS